MTILVTGAGGFLGGGIARALCANGEDVRTLQRGDYPFLEDLEVDIHKGSIVDRETVIAASRGCEAVFHVAAKAGVWGDYQDYYRSNVTGTANVLEACRVNNIKKLIYTSSPSIVFDGKDENGITESMPIAESFMTHYQSTKAEAERLVLQANSEQLATVALRPHLIFGPGDPHLAPRIIARAKTGKLKLVGNRKNLVDITYIDNAVKAHMLAYEKLQAGAACAGNAYFISNDEPLPMSDIVNRILTAAGMPAITKTVPAPVAYALGVFLENIYRLFALKGEPFMTRFTARVLSRAHWYNISAAKRDLGYTPDVSIEEGMRRFAQALANE